MMKMSLKTPERPPIATRVELISSAHGEQWVDHYAWLKADNWQEAMEDPTKLPAPIVEYLKAENEYYDLATANLTPLHDELVTEIRGRMTAKLESIPETDGPYKYRFCYVENAEHQIRDIETGLDKDYFIENVGTATWGDDQTVFYTRFNGSHRELQVYKHVLGSNPEHDVLVFNEVDERFGCDVYRSLSRSFIFIQTSTYDQDEYWYIPVNNLNAPPTLIQARMEGLEYNVENQGDRFIIGTNANGATDWKLVETPINATSMEHWTDLVAHQAGQMIEDVVVFQDWIVWLEIVNALPQIAYMDKNGTIMRVIFDEEAYSLSICSQLHYQSQSLVFEYSSPTTPTETYEFNLKTAERVLVKQQLVPSGHNPKDYITCRFAVESHDGAQVPVTLLYRRDTPIDGTAPALLYGYGSYGSSISAQFALARLSLVDRGFVYVIAHVRGGRERGNAWYEDAKLERKTNSFHDFIAVGDALVAQGFCAAGKIVSLGESAGGLLVAASMNMKPELFAGVIAIVPDVDVLNIMLDDNLPGIPDHWPLWGNPIKSKAAFDSIRSYSPYENIKAVAYPALYVTAGVFDHRVAYWQPAKWVAKIRALKTDNNIVLFKTNMQSGHFGKTGRFENIDNVAQMYAFAISVTAD